MIRFYNHFRAAYANILQTLWHSLPFDDLTKQKAKSRLFRSLSFLLHGTETYRRWETFSTRAGLNQRSPHDLLCREQLLNSSPFEIITTRHTLYVAHLIKNALLESGRSANISFNFSSKNDRGQIFFVICPQMFRKLPKNYIAFQMEQSISPRWFTPDYLSVLNHACAVLDYSLKNIEYLTSNGLPFERLFYMPIGAFRDYDAYLRKSGYLSNAAERDIDVLFYGDPSCQRRQCFLDKIKGKFNLYVASEVFGGDLYALLRRAKIIVNIHYYENALLETTRIYEALSMGVPIVSECSQDIKQYEELEGVVVFTKEGDVDDMISAVTNFLESNEALEQRRAAVRDFVQGNERFIRYFNRYLLAMDAISLDDYSRKVSFSPDIADEVPKMCLSLPETPLRTRSFIGQEVADFQIVEGLRNSIGWIGCGLSYKYIARTLTEKGSRLAVICEDDACFPSDFNCRLDRIIAYLGQTRHPWHIFAGMIAHLHPDAKILRIEKYDGVEYVYIDTMTSMVMNVYSSAGLDLIRRWNEENVDPYTNTIDRYLEGFADLVAIVTLPFLVGHHEDQVSTLWGIKNVQYLELIGQSERLLAEKVADYKSKPRL